VVDHPVTLVTRGDMTQAGPMLAALGLAVTAGLHARHVRGAVLWGILLTAIGGWVSGAAAPPAALFSAPPSPWPIVGKLDLGGALALPKLELFAILLGFFFVDFFDTLGTLVGVSAKAGYLDEKGRLPHAKGAFMADALGTTLGAAMGTSTVTTFVESAAGVRVGGRTGLTALVVAGCFLVSPFLAPVLLAIPPFATAPALIMVGLFMAEGLADVDFTDPEEGLPAFLTVVVMPFTFSISEGIVAGVLGYVGVKALAGNGRDVPVGLWVLAVLFALRLALLKG
jgi:AGZA family xanthine/uracil permease-like MFS transporter